MKTFEEAAFEVAEKIDHWLGAGLTDLEELEYWHSSLEHIVANYNEVLDERFLIHAYTGLAATAARVGRRRWETRLAADWVVTLCAKQRDYGPQNILKFGHRGLVVRTWDKIARVENLSESGREAANEPLEDSLWDIIGYCMIGIMLCEGTFELPLED